MDILAASDERVYHFVIIVAVVLLWTVGGLVQRAKQKQAEREARERAAREKREAPPQEQAPTEARASGARPQQPQGQAPPQPPKAPKARSVQEIVQAMRQAARQRVGGRKARSQPEPVPPPPPVRQPAPERQQPVEQRHIVPSASGQQVTQEAERLSSGLQRQEQERSRRLREGPHGLLTQQREDPTRASVGPEELNLVQLNAAEARRAIIYSEILGAPLALRRGQATWEL